jgi:hypothetical protein
MLARCRDAFRNDAEYYWGKGIKVCDRWNTVTSEGKRNRDAFANFLEDMGERPSKRHTLGRLDPELDYDPDNCEWQTLELQNAQLNFKGDKKRTVDGETRTMGQWAEHLGLAYKSLLKRLNRGWGDDAFRYRCGERRPKHPEVIRVDTAA